ncbi:hypothetical protein JOD21_001164 [Jeotgalibacillus terrae]|nr:hypothetical protein [Jeotgalibacillus terrae]
MTKDTVYFLVHRHQDERNREFESGQAFYIDVNYY